MKQRAYDWENDLFGLFDQDRPATLKEPEVAPFATRCANISAERWRGKAKLAPMRVTLRPRGKGPAFGGAAGVTLPRWSWSRPVIAHEVAHWIETAEELESGALRPAHGPHWLGWYVELLHRACGFDTRRLIRSASFYRLSIVPKSGRIAKAMHDLRVTPATA
jgi:hypothetical protein